MMRTLGTLCVALALGGLLLLGAACTGSDVLNTGNAPVALPTSIEGDALGFECVVLNYSAIELRPMSPEAQQALGGSNFGMLVNPVGNVDFNTAEACSFAPGNSLPTVTLSSGTYDIVNITIANPLLFDLETNTFRTCNGFRNIAPSYAPLTLEVSPGQANSLSFVMDVQAMSDAIAAGGCANFFDNITSILTIQ